MWQDKRIFFKETPQTTTHVLDYGLLNKIWTPKLKVDSSLIKLPLYEILHTKFIWTPLLQMKLTSSHFFSEFEISSKVNFGGDDLFKFRFAMLNEAAVTMALVTTRSPLAL